MPEEAQAGPSDNPTESLKPEEHDVGPEGRDDKKDTRSAVAVLREIVPKRILIVLMMIFVGLAVVPLLLGAFVPTTYSTGMGRFCLKLLLSVSLAVFMFVLYPDDIHISKIPWLNVGLQVGGPVALFFVIFGLMTKYMPDDRGRFFRAFDQGTENTLIAHDIVSLGPGDQTPGWYYKVIDPDPSKRQLVGVYVHFDSSAQSQKASVYVGAEKTGDVAFDLYGTDTFPLRPPPQGR